jgi:hypothetical protein
MALSDLFKRRPATTNGSERTESGRGHSSNPRLNPSGTTRGYIVPDEYKAELIGQHGMQVWDQMWRSDPDVFRNWSMLVSLFVASTWDIQPYGGDEADEKAQKHAEFVKWALFEQMAPKFPNHLMQAMRTLRHGFVPFEQVWRPDTYQGKQVLTLDRLALRLPRSIDKWEADGDRLLRIVQNTIHESEVTLEAKDILYYRWGAEGDNWEGTSPFRHAYKPWKLKETLEIVEAIGLERYHVGIPVGYPADGAATEQLDQLEQALANIRSNESSYIRMPGPKTEGWEIEILTPHGGAGGADMRGAIEAHRDGISAAFLQEFMRQGQKNVGTNATAQTQQDPFMAWAEAMCGVIVEDPVNEQLIPRLVSLNFDDADGFPCLHASVIDPIALEQLAAAAASMVSSGLIYVDDPLEDYLRDRFDFPPADPEQREQRKVAEEEARQAELEATKNPAPVGEDGEERHEAVTEKRGPDGSRTVRQEKTVRRSKARTLSHADGHPDVMTEGEVDAVRRILDQARPTAARFTHTLTHDHRPDRQQIERQFEDLFTSIWQQGHETVTNELVRQASGARAVTLKNTTVKDPTEPRTLARLAAEAVIRSVQGVLDRLALLKAPPEVVDAEVITATQRAVEREAQDTAVLALNGGRKAAAQEQGAIVMGAIYTAILDERSCQACEHADDNQIRALHDPELTPVPNPLCEGWTRCRCLHAYVLSDDEPFRP